MILNELFNYKNKIMEDICTSKNIIRLLTDVVDPIVPNTELPYKQVFPFEFVPETVDGATTFICFDVDIADVYNKTFYEPALYVWIFTHKSKLRLPDGAGVRTDCISHEVDSILNGNRNYGLGELNLESVRRFSPIQDYQGRVLTYSCRDFNRVGVSKPVPARRG